MGESSANPSVAVACIRRAIERIDTALKEEAYIRPSRQRTEPRPQTTGSCSNCKKLKAKCEEGGPGLVCLRCRASPGVICEYPVQKQPGRKQGLTKRAQLLQAMRTDLVEALRLLDAGEFSHVSPASTASPGNQTSSSLGSAMAGPRSVASIQLAAPAPITSSPVAVESSRSTGSSTLPQLPPLPPTTHTGTEQPLQHNALDGIDNPLEVLAHVSLNDKEDDEEALLDDSFAFAVKEEQKRILAARLYYSTGLYAAIDDTDIDLDPVTLDILSERDLRRLVALYFDKMRPFFFHLDRRLHTSDFLRNTSPFLTTALCYVTATYDHQSSQQLVEALRTHVDQLATRVFKRGFKSVEIVQAFSFLCHWAPPTETWAQDRAWAWMGEALRVATEIRMDRPMDDERINQYRARTPLTSEMVANLRETSLRSWYLLWSGNLMLAVHSGRIVGKSFIGALRSSLPKLPSHDPDYNYNANELLNRILANALNLSSRLQDKPLPDSFKLYDKSWRGELETWVKDWPEANTFIQVRYFNARIMLLSLGLKFSPPTTPVLAQVQQAALATLRIVPHWVSQGDALRYASNSAITNIAYGATLMLKIISVSDPSRDPALKQLVLDLCSKVVDVLVEIGDNRVNATSVASLQAARMQSLLRRINAMPTPVVTTTTQASIPASIPGFDLIAMTIGTGGPAVSASGSPNTQSTMLPPFDFATDTLGDTSMLFEDFSTSNLLSMMGDEFDVSQWSWNGTGATAPWDQFGQAQASLPFDALHSMTHMDNTL
ncbi:hypothetical protein OIO90_000065 [Microbotryomycetes sp. JL221]|nr:hypothetical protein OIO90_000065 [Microbotryomycetes sp. JL221]